MDHDAKRFIMKTLFLGVVLYIVSLILSFFISHAFDWKSRQDPRKRVLYEAVPDNTGIILIGDSVWISAYVESKEETIWWVLQKLTGKHVFNATLNGAEETDFKKVFRLLPDRGEGAFVFLNINPTRLLPRHSSEERPNGNYANEYAGLVGNNFMERAFVLIKKPLLIYDLDVLKNCIFTKNYFRVSKKVREANEWKMDGDSMLKTFTTRFERHFIDTEKFRELDWIKELDLSLEKKGYRFIIVMTPLNNNFIKKYPNKDKISVFESKFSKAHEVLVQFLQENRIKYIDCYRGFDSDSFVGLIHTNADGDRRMAEKMANYIARYNN